MSNLSFLKYHNRYPKTKHPRLFPSLDRKNSVSLPTLQPDLSEMMQAFNKFDTNRDGKISQEEYKATLRAAGLDMMVEDVPTIFQVVDLDGDGYIDFKEFVQAQENTTDIQTAFRAFDINGDGKISAEEVMEVLRLLGERCSLHDCRRMVRAVDADGDGMIGMDEFITMISQQFRI